MDTNSIEYKNIIKVIRNRYILALTIIIFSLILSQTIIQYNISNETSYSRIINISGRQRMLSQKISKDVYAIYLASDKKTVKFYTDELETSVDTWKKSNIDLQNGNPKEGLLGQNSKNILEMFSSIKEYHQIIVSTSYDIISLVKSDNYDRTLLWNKIQLIKNNESKFLEGMDDIVFQYDLEAKEKLLMIKYIEIMLLFITLIIILLEVLFIFAPTRKSIIEAFDDINENRKNFLKLFEAAPEAMFLVDDKTYDILLINKRGKILKNQLFENVKELNLKNIDCFNSENYNELLEKIKSNKKIENHELLLKTETEKNLAMLVSSTKLYFNRKSTILLGMTDITNQKQSEEFLKKLANFDELTGLLNRRYGWLILENMYLKAKSDLIDFSICFIDIDGLKSVNDNWGHDEGDWYIKTVSKCITENVEKHNCVFRYGGDEIIIVFMDYTSEQAYNTIGKVQENLSALGASENKPYKLSISCGIINYKSNNSYTLEELVMQADSIMYENKRLKKASR